MRISKINEHIKSNCRELKNIYFLFYRIRRIRYGVLIIFVNCKIQKINIYIKKLKIEDGF